MVGPLRRLVVGPKQQVFFWPDDCTRWKCEVPRIFRIVGKKKAAGISRLGRRNEVRWAGRAGNSGAIEKPLVAKRRSADSGHIERYAAANERGSVLRLLNDAGRRAWGAAIDDEGSCPVTRGL